MGTVSVPRAASARGIGAAAAALPQDGDRVAEDDLLLPAQWGPPPGRGRRRRRRCRLVQRRVAFRDRYGRTRYRLVTREICR
jgi:hypothetical protein